jgi:hypothetical protein
MKDSNTSSLLGKRKDRSMDEEESKVVALAKFDTSV